MRHVGSILVVLLTVLTIALAAPIVEVAPSKSSRRLLGVPFVSGNWHEWHYKNLNDRLSQSESAKAFEVYTFEDGSTKVVPAGSLVARSDSAITSKANGECNSKDEGSPSVRRVASLLQSFRGYSRGDVCQQSSQNSVALFGVNKDASIVYSTFPGREITCDELFDALITIFHHCSWHDRVEGWLNVQTPQGSATVGIATYVGGVPKDED